MGQKELIFPYSYFLKPHSKISNYKLDVFGDYVLQAVSDLNTH
jgi:hypothetical protein